MGRLRLSMMTPETSHLLGGSGHIIHEGCSKVFWLFSCPQSFPAPGSLPTFVFTVCGCVCQLLSRV